MDQSSAHGADALEDAGAIIDSDRGCDEDMSEQVVVVCSAGEQRPAMDLCSKLEDQGLTCWSPVREEDPDAAVWTLPSKIRSARAMVLVTRDAAGHGDAVDAAARSKLAVIVASPDDAGREWSGVLRELADALGLAPDWLSERATSPGAQPRTHLAEDEEEFLEYIAENVSEAQVFVRFGLFDRAAGRLKAVFAKAPRNLEAHDELLKIYLEEEDWKKAAATAADFLDCVRYRGDDESYAILRAHLLSMGFTVDDGPPVAVGYADVEPVPTKFVDAAPKPPGVTPAHVQPHAAAPPSSSAPSPVSPPSPKGAEPVPLELPVLRNFRASNPVFQSSGVDSELSGIDFFIDHGMLDEAKMRVDQLAHENPDHEGVRERLERIKALGLSSMKSTIALELDDPWDAAVRAPETASADAYFGSAATTPPVVEAVPANGPAGDGDSLICTAFVPEAVEPGDMFIIRLCIHLPEQGGHPMLESAHDRRESNMLARNVPRGQTLQVSLNLPGFEIDENNLRISWVGEPDSVEFGVVAPFGQASGTVTGVLSVRTDAGPAGEFSIAIPVS